MQLHVKLKQTSSYLCHPRPHAIANGQMPQPDAHHHHLYLLLCCVTVRTKGGGAGPSVKTPGIHGCPSDHDVPIRPSSASRARRHHCILQSCGRIVCSDSETAPPLAAPAILMYSPCSPPTLPMNELWILHVPCRPSQGTSSTKAFVSQASSSTASA